MHPNARLLFQRYVVPRLSSDSRILEVGPDLMPSTLQLEASGRYAAWETADLATARGAHELTYAMVDENKLPIESDTFDVVVSSSVIEHVRRPWAWFAELARVCRPSGIVATVGPISWPEHKDEFVPHDCWRILPDGMLVLAEEAGLEVELCESMTLEPAEWWHWYPGESYRFLRPVRPTVVRGAIKALDIAFRRPRSAAVDCITVARKPAVS